MTVDFVENEELLQNIRMSDVVDEMKENYITYAEHVIKDRAIPDSRDGLKPVHRRILWAMWQMGCHYNSNYKKSARVVGDAMGKYHPHGDASIYSALVRLAQDFVLNNVLVDGKGNFGGIDGTSPAAQRYTECRLSKFAEVIYFKDINENTVDFVDNYAGDEKEPVILPARLPMTLLTAVTGIAVGMATDIPPHNLNEVCDATIAYIDNPFIDYVQLSKILTAPDSPLGGLINVDNYENVYSSGSGVFKWKSVVDFETNGKNKSIVIKSIPIASNSTDIIQDIVKSVQNESVIGVVDVRDESTKDGLRICVDLAPKNDHITVMNSIYKNTRLQSTVKYNSVTICSGQPKSMGLKDIFSDFVGFRKNIITKRTEFRLNKSENRKEIVDGILKVVNNSDKVIKIIKNGDSNEDIIELLKNKIKLTNNQANYVFNMPIRRFSKIDSNELLKECCDLDKYIEEQKEILSDENKINNIIKNEIKEIKDEFGTERKMNVVNDFDVVELKEVTKQEEIMLSFYADGNFKMISINSCEKQKFSDNSFDYNNGNYPVYFKIVDPNKDVMIFTDKGNRYRLNLYSVPFNDNKKFALKDFIPKFDSLNEKVISVIKSNLDEDEFLVMIGSNGKIRKLVSDVVNVYRDNVNDYYPVNIGGDVCSVIIAKDSDNVVITTKKGMVLYMSLKSISAMKTRKSPGVAGIKLSSNDQVLSLSIVGLESFIYTISKNGYAKKTSISQHMLKRRGCVGAYGMSIEKQDELKFAKIIDSSDKKLFIFTNFNNIIQIKPIDIVEQNRTSRGVLLKKMDNNEIIVKIVE